ncbi:hypothetical protein F0562_019052 [Nyssa sinensis]|uniref:Uncharacterized protein n=1 Tax=Nyssa sinensis TaxID=561372 RepID=A0A5J4ZAR6_9ASTE|nr:hypothetical protein F0562_019052 [Nyssa sinensis]
MNRASRNGLKKPKNNKFKTQTGYLKLFLALEAKLGIPNFTKTEGEESLDRHEKQFVNLHAKTKQSPRKEDTHFNPTILTLLRPDGKMG